MSKDDLLVQDEIDALLHSVGGFDTHDSAGTDNKKDGANIRPYDPTTQHRVIRERLQALDLINERFARLFRISLFNLIRRNADITIESVEYQSYSVFSRNVPVPANINVIAMKPLRGSALVTFPPSLVFMVVDNLFGGDGRFHTKSEGREFTNTEQRIIRRLLNLATEAYQESWHSIYPVQIAYLRSEMQAKFANITNSPNEIVVNTTFHLEVGNMSSEFNICIPYSMVEPLKELLTNPLRDNVGKRDNWTQRMAGELRNSEVELRADFVSLPCRIGEVLSLKVGDVLPMELPEIVSARVDGVPVLECRYGRRGEHMALRVERIIDHSMNSFLQPGQASPAPQSPLEESDHE